jgi:hypothetical protein
MKKIQICMKLKKKNVNMKGEALINRSNVFKLSSWLVNQGGRPEQLIMTNQMTW